MRVNALWPRTTFCPGSQPHRCWPEHDPGDLAGTPARSNFDHLVSRCCRRGCHRVCSTEPSGLVIGEQHEVGAPGYRAATGERGRGRGRGRRQRSAHPSSDRRCARVGPGASSVRGELPALLSETPPRSAVLHDAGSMLHLPLGVASCLCRGGHDAEEDRRVPDAALALGPPLAAVHCLPGAVGAAAATRGAIRRRAGRSTWCRQVSGRFS